MPPEEAILDEKPIVSLSTRKHPAATLEATLNEKLIVSYPLVRLPRPHYPANSTAVTAQATPADSPRIFPSPGSPGSNSTKQLQHTCGRGVWKGRNDCILGGVSPAQHRRADHWRVRYFEKALAVSLFRTIYRDYGISNATP